MDSNLWLLAIPIGAWVIVALVNRHIAIKKGRRPLPWMLLALVLSLWSTFILYLTPAKNDTKAS